MAGWWFADRSLSWACQCCGAYDGNAYIARQLDAPLTIDNPSTPVPAHSGAAPTLTVAASRVLGILKDVKARGSYWTARCPGHDDKKASLSVTVGSVTGAVLLKCHGGCSLEQILGGAGLTAADLWDQPKPAPNGNGTAQGVEARPRLVKSYDYLDLEGTLVYQACRFEPKDFRQRRRNEQGEWIWNLQGVEPILYRLPEVVEAVATGRKVLIVEGEKDADALWQLGFYATTSPMGAGKWRDEYGSHFAGVDVAILPDNDEIGRAHADTVANSVLAHGGRPRIVVLPGVPAKGDVSDWITAGGTTEQLIALMAAAKPYGPRKVFWRLDEVIADSDAMRPPPPVVPYLAWSGRSTLIAAREKSGKSTLAAYVAAAVSHGSDFLGEPCAKGPVIIIGLEEFLGDCARRLVSFHADPAHVYIMDAFLGGPVDRAAEIRGHIERVKPVLVILDSLMAFAQGIVTDANNATQTQAVVQSLTDLAHELGPALGIIHHAKKSDGTYRDSSAIGGAVDIIAEIFQPDEFKTSDPNRRRMRPMGRVPTRPVDFRFDHGEYTVVDFSTTRPVRTALDVRVSDVVRAAPGCNANYVCEQIDDQRAAVLAKIRQMLASRMLVNDGTSHKLALRLSSVQPRQTSLGETD